MKGILVNTSGKTSTRNPVPVPGTRNAFQLWILLCERGACTGLDRPDDMFPDVLDRAAVERARRVCGGCPVVAECGEYADLTGQKHGVWGGRLCRPADPGGMRSVIVGGCSRAEGAVPA